MTTLLRNTDNNLIQWTGEAAVYGHCPGMTANGTMGSLPLLNLKASRKQILDYFNNSWTLTEILFSGLSSEAAFYCRPYHHLRHPLMFYFAHPAVLYVNKLRVAGLFEGPVNVHFEALFEVGVDEMRWDDLHEGQKSVWPSLTEVLAYRKKVYSRIRQLIETHPLLEENHPPISQDSPLWALVMGFEHERIHLETSSVLIRELPLEFVRRPREWPQAPVGKANGLVPKNTMLSVPGGTVALGKPSDWPSYGWDNEYGYENRVHGEFLASQFLISNGEFLDFIKAGGYLSESFWTAEGWAWRSFRNTKYPSFWVPRGPAGLHQYQLRTIFELIELPLAFPVCVNFHEAKAYCSWKTEKDKTKTAYRLLTEAEHHAIRDSRTKTISRGILRDSVMGEQSTDKLYNMNLTNGGESTVDAHPANDKGFHDTFGNVWQWSEDTFHPLPGSKPHPYYDDFSVPCYDGNHQMIFGGSFASTGDLASIWARFHFRAHFFQHAGFRLARSEETESKGTANYETKEMLDKYLLMHWGTEKEIWEETPAIKRLRPDVVHLPLKCAELVFKYSTKFDRALDLGCAVGRSSFEMAKHFKEVLGVDYSREFIDCAQKLKKSKQLAYWRKDSGAEGVHLNALVDGQVDVTRLNFEQGDACALPPSIKNFDAVLLANVLCRLPEPLICLERMQNLHALVKPGGVLVMTTPFSWLDEYTPKSRWLNGISDVKKVLTDFELIHQEELPFLIREHRRKFEYIVTHASVWKRKG